MEAFLLIVVVLFLFGACVGSFLNVVIYRVPRGLSVAHPRRSFCPACRQQIPWYRNIPILSWILLNGRCANCRSPISIQYLLVEVATGALFALLAFSRLDGVAEPAAADLLGLGADCLFAALVVAVTVIDFRHAIIPDPLTVPWMPLLVVLVWIEPGILRGHAFDATAAGAGRLVPAAILAGLALGAAPALLLDFVRRRRHLVPFGEEPESALPTVDERFSIWQETRELALPLLLPAGLGAVLLALLVGSLDLAARPGPAAALASAAGAGAGLTVVFLIRFVFSALFRREAMGLGDAKFLGLAGAFFGIEGTLLVFLLASVLGAVPALIGLLGKLPVATGALLLGAILPLVAMDQAITAFGPNLALAVLMPVPVLVLVLFLRRLRRSDVSLSAMPFGPFLAVAALLLAVWWDPVLRFILGLVGE